eukprot:937476-Amphidinium_carterae.1
MLRMLLRVWRFASLVVITVSSHLFRLWAGLRAKQLRLWAQENLHASVYGGVVGRSAPLCAAVVSMGFTVAEVEDEPHTAVSFDFSKCYDTLPVQDVIEAARRIGVPRGVTCALNSWYRQHR